MAKWCAATSPGLAVFHVLRPRQNDADGFLYAFDPALELDGADMRREPIEMRKATLASILRKARHGTRFNEQMEFEDGETVFCARLQDGPRRHRVEAEGINLSLGAVFGLGQDEEPRLRGREAGGRRGLAMINRRGEKPGPQRGNRRRFPYEPRVVGGKLLMPAELHAIHRYVVETPVLEDSH